RDGVTVRRTAGLRLVPVAASTWAAGAVSILVPAAAPSVALALWCAALLLTAVGGLRSMQRIPRPARRVALVVAVLALVGAASAASHVAMTAPSRAAAAAFAVEGGRAIEVHATVIGKV